MTVKRTTSSDRTGQSITGVLYPSAQTLTERTPFDDQNACLDSVRQPVAFRLCGDRRRPIRDTRYRGPWAVLPQFAPHGDHVELAGALRAPAPDALFDELTPIAAPRCTPPSAVRSPRASTRRADCMSHPRRCGQTPQPARTVAYRTDRGCTLFATAQHVTSKTHTLIPAGTCTGSRHGHSHDRRRRPSAA